MDKFEREYFENLRANLPQFENKLSEVARERIKMFSAALTRQLITEEQNFDLIMGPGNSGLFMTKIAETTYQVLNKEMPKVINIPIERIIEGSKVKKLLVGSAEIPHFDKKKINVLFVDDEIMRAVTAKASFELLLESNPNLEHVDATIIAENHFFEWHYYLPKVSVRFFAHARLIQWINGVIGHFIPDDLFEKIKKVLPEVETHNDAMAIVIGGALKKVVEEKPYYDTNANKILSEKIENYEEERKKLMDNLIRLVEDGIVDYKEGRINFRF